MSRRRDYRPARTGPSCLTMAGIGCGVLVLGAMLLGVVGMAIGLHLTEQAKKELAEADRLWDAGQKPEAVTRYRSLVASGRATDTPRGAVVYQRVIEFDVGQGNTDSARQLADQALAKNLDVRSDDPAVAGVLAEARAARDKRLEDERVAQAKRMEEAREAAAKRQQEDAIRREEERKNAPKMSVEIVEVRLERFRTADGEDTHMICVDWKNTGNRPVRGVTATLRVLDAKGNEVYAAKDYYIYSAGNSEPGIAPGGTYLEPNDQGHVIPPLADRDGREAKAKIVRVLEKTPE